MILAVLVLALVLLLGLLAVLGFLYWKRRRGESQIQTNETIFISGPVSWKFGTQLANYEYPKTPKTPNYKRLGVHKRL